MKLVVFGAAGRTGRLIVERALGHGHTVTAFIHRTPLDLAHPDLARIEGDARDFDAVSSAVEGHTGVAFALSGAGNLESGIANVIHAMAEHDVRRVAVLSAAGTFARNDRALSLGYRAMVATTLRPVYDDLEAMEMRVMASDLDWTIVRPFGLSDAPALGHYRLALDGSLLPKAARVSRADVAAVMLKALETDTYRRCAVVVAQ